MVSLKKRYRNLMKLIQTNIVFIFIYMLIISQKDMFVLN